MGKNTRTLLMAAIIAMACLLRSPITAVGTLVDLIRLDITADSAVLGLLTTIPLLTWALLSPLAGRIGTGLGEGRAILIGLAAAMAGIAVRSYCGTVGLFVGTFAIGTGICFGNVLIPSIIRARFFDRVGMATGAFTMSLSCFAGISAGVSLPLADAGFGWRGSLALWGVLAAAAMLLWLPQKELRLGAAAESGAAAGADGIAAQPNLFRSGTAWWLTAFMAMQSFLFYSFVAWLPAILRERGIDAAVSGYYALAYQFIGIPVSFTMPTLGARLKDQRLLIAAVGAVYVSGLVMMLLGQSAGILLAGTLICGISTAASFSLCMLLISLRTRNAADASRLSGMVQSVGYAVAALGPLLVGALYDASGSFVLPTALMVGVAGLILAASRFVGRAHIIGD